MDTFLALHVSLRRPHVKHACTKSSARSVEYKIGDDVRCANVICVSHCAATMFNVVESSSLTPNIFNAGECRSPNEWRAKARETPVKRAEFKFVWGTVEQPSSKSTEARKARTS